MQVPIPPSTNSLRHLAPSQYEAGRACKARLAWMTCGRRDELPVHPKALLGTCFHAVLEAAATGRLAVQDDEAIGESAREMFDRQAAIAYAGTHALLRVKYRSVEDFPYYYLYRERAALLAQRVAKRRGSSSPAAVLVREATPATRLIETTLTSRDGLIFGRPDYVDLHAHEIVDYKTGASADDAPAVSPAEKRQLNLYVHLALENGLPVSRGVIVRPGGRRDVTDVTEAQAKAEGRHAREVLEAFNQIAGRPFDTVAQPAAETCQFCPCVPFCESFWRDAASAWLEECGTHIEGRITSITESLIQGNQVLTFELEVSRGTVDSARVFVEQVPESWTTVEGCPRPSIGDVLRIIHGRVTSSGGASVVKIDRTLTSIWTVPARTAPSGGAGTNSD